MALVFSDPTNHLSELVMENPDGDAFKVVLVDKDGKEVTYKEWLTDEALKEIKIWLTEHHNNQPLPDTARLLNIIRAVRGESPVA